MKAKTYGVRFDEAVIARIDEATAVLDPGGLLDSDRSKTIRALVLLGLAEIDKRKAPEPARSFGPAPPYVRSAPAPVPSKAPPPVKQQKAKPEPIDGREIAAWMDARRAEREASAPVAPQVTCEWCEQPGHDIDHCPKPCPPIDVEPINNVDDLNRLIPETFAD